MIVVMVMMSETVIERGAGEMMITRIESVIGVAGLTGTEMKVKTALERRAMMMIWIRKREELEKRI